MNRRELIFGAGCSWAGAGFGAGRQAPAEPGSAGPATSAPAVAPAWFDGARPAAVAEQAVVLLAGAADHGLEPSDYDAGALAAAVLHARSGLPPDAAEALAGALQAAFLRFLHDLHHGRVDPRRIHMDFSVGPLQRFDPAAALAAALAGGQLGPAVQAALPPLPQYTRLREALAMYRGLIGHAAWAAALPPLPPRPGPARRGPALEPGGPWAGLDLLAARLATLGDLQAVPLLAAGNAYDTWLVDAVRRFQRRHGLADDGVVGARTLAQLQVTPASRARQIELTMERLRWTPLLQGPRMIVINIPEFTLRAYEVVGQRISVQLEMRVVVGKALDTRTPLFDEDMRSIEFSPFWNVPASIARRELVPRLRRDPGHFAAQGFEFVGPGGRVHTELTPAALDAVLAGALRIRQRPGPANALGDVKFVFPNDDNIYLHHTPATGLFDRARRDFSHGCIRVEQPVALAAFVLQGRPDWPEARVVQAMRAGVLETVQLHTPIPVLIAYGTVVVKAGRVHFYEDIYGHDRVLDAALRARSAQLSRRPDTPLDPPAPLPADPPAGRSR